MPSDPDVLQHFPRYFNCIVTAVPAGPGMARCPRVEDYELIADILEAYAQDIRTRKTIPEGAAQSVRYEETIVGWYACLPTKQN